MKKKTTISDILNELCFSQTEGDAFIRCLNAVKDEQKNDGENAELVIKKIIEEVIENENS